MCQDELVAAADCATACFLLVPPQSFSLLLMSSLLLGCGSSTQHLCREAGGDRSCNSCISTTKKQTIHPLTTMNPSSNRKMPNTRCNATSTRCSHPTLPFGTAAATTAALAAQQRHFLQRSSSVINPTADKKTLTCFHFCSRLLLGKDHFPLFGPPSSAWVSVLLISSSHESVTRSILLLSSSLQSSVCQSARRLFMHAATPSMALCGGSAYVH